MTSICSRVNAQSHKDEATNSFFEALYKDKDSEANQIADGLFLGSYAAAQDRRAMQKRGVTHALIVHPTLPEPHPQHFKYSRAPLLDDPAANMLEVLPDALAFLGNARKEKKKVYVFCMKGISRSSSVIIAWIMLEKGLGFDEAWKMCEEKRPIVYPNIGFQQQLRWLEKCLADVKQEPWEKKLKHFRSKVPFGVLSGPDTVLPIRDLIGDSMNSAFNDVEKLAERIFTQPQLLQKREQWKRHGLYFENMHKYKTMPSDIALIPRARAVADKLASLPKVFSDALKGVKLATAVASQIQSWITIAEPLLNKEKEDNDAPSKPKPEAVKREEVVEPGKVPSWVNDTLKETMSGSSSDDSTSGSGKKKKSKKAKKMSKKDKKKEKKAAKAIRKAGKAAAKIEQLARRAELAATNTREQAQEAAAQAEKLSAEIARMEADEELDAADAAADAAAKARADLTAKRKQGNGSGSGSESPRVKRR